MSFKGISTGLMGRSFPPPPPPPPSSMDAINCLSCNQEKLGKYIKILLINDLKVMHWAHLHYTDGSWDTGYSEGRGRRQMDGMHLLTFLTSLMGKAFLPPSPLHDN